METINEKTKNSLWAACGLTMAIDTNGKLPDNYKGNSNYTKAGFVGDLFSCSGGKGGIHAGLAGLTKDNEVIIAFRGTDVDLDKSVLTILDIICDVNAKQVDFQIDKTTYAKGKVHRGFLDAISFIYREFIDYLKKTGYDKYPVYVTGHSKGGGMATLMNNILLEEFKHKIISYTFASPRVGDDTFRRNYNANSSIEHYRIEAFLDVVPHLPLTNHEKKLLERFGTIETILGNVYKTLLGDADYFPVGNYIGIDDREKQKKYAIKLPFLENNINEEKLNSFCAAEELIRKVNISEVIGVMNGIHNNDYPG